MLVSCLLISSSLVTIQQILILLLDWPLLEANITSLHFYNSTWMVPLCPQNKRVFFSRSQRLSMTWVLSSSPALFFDTLLSHYDICSFQTIWKYWRLHGFPEIHHFRLRMSSNFKLCSSGKLLLTWKPKFSISKFCRPNGHYSTPSIYLLLYFNWFTNILS